MGEGWGDFVALLQAVRAEDAAVVANAGWAGVYATAGWVSSGLDTTGAPNQGYYYGIRRTPYSTDMSKAPQTMTMVMPMTMNPSDEAPSRMAKADSRPRKRGLRLPKTATARRTDARIVSSRMRKRRRGVVDVSVMARRCRNGLPIIV